MLLVINESGCVERFQFLTPGKEGRAGGERRGLAGAAGKEAEVGEPKARLTASPGAAYNYQ
jgi:hypothetical protein